MGKLYELITQFKRTNHLVLFIIEMADKDWHHSRDNVPFNHPGVLAGARTAFMGNDSSDNTFTMSQLCFALAVVSSIILSISSSIE